MYINELYHHGVIGMKWGVRKDVAASASKAALLAEDVVPSSPKHPVYGSGKKYSKITDDELQRRVRRLNMEKQYSDLVGDTRYVKTGEEKTREMLQTVGATLAIASTAFGIIDTISKNKSE